MESRGEQWVENAYNVMIEPCYMGNGQSNELNDCICIGRYGSDRISASYVGRRR